MSSLALTTYDEELTENFLNTFQLLSEKQKKIWQILRWYAINYRQVFPSHAKIAQQVGCCRDTVIKALKLFESNGWLCSTWRCYRSKVYYLIDFLLKFDTRKNETFQKNPTEDTTVKPTLYNTYSSSSNVRYEKQEQKPRTVQDIDPEKKQILEKIGITEPKDIWCLARYSHRILRLALEDKTTRFAKQPIRRLAAWITDRCKKLKSKYGE